MNNQTQVEYERSKPLGQSIALNASSKDDFEIDTAFKGCVTKTESPCEIPKEWYGKFSMRTDCRRKAMENAGKTLRCDDEKNWFHPFPGNNSGTTVKTEYYVRSSVVGGRAIAELG